jgi:hypothetical protein
MMCAQARVASFQFFILKNAPTVCVASEQRANSGGRQRVTGRPPHLIEQLHSYRTSHTECMHACEDTLHE